MKLIVLEAFSVFITSLVAKYVFGIDIFDFKSPRGRMIGMLLALACLYGAYYVIFTPDAIGNIGASVKRLQ